MLRPEDFEAVCGTGVARLHAWVRTDPSPIVYTITSRLQSDGFRPASLVIVSPECWVIYDFRIGRRSQLFAEGPVPATQLSGNPLRLEMVQVGVDVQFDVAYVGACAEGSVFQASLVGAVGTRQLLNFQSSLIPRSEGWRVLLDLGERLLDFRLGRDGLELSSTTIDRPAIDLALSLLEEWNGKLGIRPVDPIVVSLRSTRDGILFGIDERAGHVLFEIGPRVAFCNLVGYVPTWWKEIVDI